MNQNIQDFTREIRRNSCLIQRLRCARGKVRPLTPEGRVLYVLKNNEGICQKALAKLLDMRPQSAGEIIAKMDADGLVTKKANAFDKRVQNIYMTEKGIEMMEKNLNNHREFHATLFEGVTDEEIKLATAVLAKMNANVEAKLETLPTQDEGKCCC